MLLYLSFQVRCSADATQYYDDSLYGDEIAMYVPVAYIFPSESDKQFLSQSTEGELVQLFKSYDDLCEQRQELENRLDEAEDSTLPWVLELHC